MSDTTGAVLGKDMIILRSVYGKVGMKYYLNPVKDPRSGRFPECVKLVNSNGDMILTDAERNSGKVYIAINRMFVVEDGTTFDLNDPWDKAEWEAIQFSPVIALARDQRDAKGNLLIDGDKKRYGTAELYVERPGYATAKRVSKKRLIHDAEDYILRDPQGAEGRLKMAKLLGKNMRNAPDADIEDFLLLIAEKDPEKIINLYRGDDINLRLLFIDAKDKGIIYIKNKVYLYSENQIVLGATDDAVITWMKDIRNRKVLELIRRETYPEMYELDQPNYEMKIKDGEKEKFPSNGQKK